MKKSYFTILGLLSTFLFAVAYYWCNTHPEYDLGALIVANGVLSLLSLISFLMLRQKVKTERAQAFVNGVYGATLLRLMVCMGAIVAYLLLNKGHLHKPSIFMMMGLYIVYTAFETIFFSRMAKQKH